MSNKPAVTLILSLSNDGSLQQALTDNLGRLLVGETPDFLKAERFKTQTSTTTDSLITPNLRDRPQPLAPCITQSLQRRTCHLIVLCAPDLLHVPWVEYLTDGHPLLQASDIHVKVLGQLDDLSNTVQSVGVDGFASRTGDRHNHPTRVNRYVFSLSYDLVDSTTLMAHLGAESYAFLLSRLHSRYASIAVQWQGLIDLPQGDDGCMCYFGAIAADEHAGLACLQAALEMRNVALSNGWKVRIGIAAGWVAVDRNQPVGLSVHLAARLQKLAAVDSIVVTQALALHFAAVFDFKPVVLHTALKGFDDIIEVAQLHDFSHALLAFPRPFNAASDTLFVGREAQLDQLQQAWQRTCSFHGSEQLIIGPPGIGKSTLIRHWIETNHIQPWILTCGPHDYRKPFAPLIQWIAKEIGFKLHGETKTPIASLQTCISRHPMLHAYRHELTYLFGASTQHSSDMFEDAEASHQQIIDAIIQWVANCCEEQPVLVVVEDYQWIDASTALWVDKLRHMAQHGSALMLVVTQRPPLVRQAMYATLLAPIRITPLNSKECQQVIGGLAPELFKNHHLVLKLEENAQGVPLFLKESVRLLRSPEYQNKLQIAMHLGVGLPVPESLQNLLMERLDQLGPARQVAQLGSFFAGLFSWDLLRAVYSNMYPTAGFTRDLDVACQLLVREKLWIETLDSDQRQFEFTHTMIHDVAYHSMWATDRKAIHRLIAQVLQEIPWNEGDSSAAELGRHLAAAGEIRAAVNHLMDAGKRSKKRGAHQVATQTMQNVLELLELVEPSDATLRSKTEAHLSLAGQIQVTQGYASTSVVDHYTQAFELSKSLQDNKSMLRALMGLQSFHFMRGSFVESHRIMNLAREIASRVKHPFTELQLEWAEANLLFYEGKLVESCTLMDACISRCKANDVGQDLIQNPQVMAIMYRAFSLWCLGRFTDSLEQSRVGRDLADAGSHRLARLQAHGIAAMVLYGCGFWEETLLAANKAIASCQPGEYKLWLAHANVMRGAALARLGSYSEGLELLRANHIQWAQHGGTLTRSYYWALEAELLLNKLDITGAQTALAGASKHLLDIPERYYTTEVDRLTGCLQLHKLDHLRVDRATYDKLLAIYSERQHYGLALRVAINLFEQVKNASMAEFSEERLIAEQRLRQSLSNVQQDTVTQDVSKAQSYLSNTGHDNVLHIHHYKRA
jgi:class 3 adenylate cyclase